MQGTPSSQTPVLQYGQFMQRPKPAAIPMRNYSWMINGVLYHGGGEKLMLALHQYGLDEAYFYNVNATPLGRSSVAGLADSFDVEHFHVIVSADQAETVFEYIFELMQMYKPNVGMMSLQRLLGSTPNVLPEGVQPEPAH